MSDGYSSVGYGGVSDGLGGKPAVLVVDFQVAFTDPKFPLGGLPMVHSATEKTAELLQVARKHNVPVASCYTAYHSVADMPRWKVTSGVRKNIDGAFLQNVKSYFGSWMRGSIAVHGCP